ncbi:MAG: TetR/AcrR family transcriptional regulator [Desulfatibacillum sp.]|nr:TetR/AcrR family transcriptional regulator [Desulfatibacillum sp.]
MSQKRAPYAKTANRKRQIIDAALQCFSEKGYTDATMEEIRTLAHSSYGSVYHHFKNKEQLAIAVYVEGIADFQNGLVEALEGGPEAEEGIRRVVEHHFSWVEANPAWARYLVLMRHADFMATGENDLTLQNKESYPALWAFIRRHIKAGALRDLPPDIYATLLIGPCQEFTQLWVSGRSSSSLETVKREIASAAWRALRNPENATQNGGEP